LLAIGSSGKSGTSLLQIESSHIAYLQGIELYCSELQPKGLEQL